MKIRRAFEPVWVAIITLGVTIGLAQTTPTALTTPIASLDHRAYLPDPALTPGVALAGVTAADLVPGYAGKVRNVPDSEKAAVYAEYHIATHAPGQYEVDHLISLELGGSNDIHNLWPQSYTGIWNAHQKDKLENELHRRVVAGTMELADAQHRIAIDWIALYIEIFPAEVQTLPAPVPPQDNAEPDSSP